ncbi:condensation domain-containing protein, partial [Methylogaea oryzae]|uniref:condensation domain-containing protein n=1 Tax=Methylogaea oryzae TaxID=1295382 RepID=UPI000B2B1B54
ARLAARHPLLRTSFDLSAAGEPIQRVHRRAEIPLIEEDWRALDEDAQEQALAQWIGEEQRRPFDWKTAPLARVFLRRRGEDRFELSLSVHHAVLDGWSAATFYTGMLRDYLSRCSPDATQRDPDHADAAAPAPTPNSSPWNGKPWPTRPRGPIGNGNWTARCSPLCRA